jgi:two-component system, chemotaxis family, protein-glutamate methylesterase/glutaminase
MRATQNATRTLKTLVVDDTALYRRAISDALASMEGVEVLGTAGNGRIALARLEELHPDLMTLDIEMPELNGIEVLEAISSWKSKPGVIVLSSHTVKGSQLTMRALELGAFDFVTKPEGIAAKGLEALRDSLCPAVASFTGHHGARLRQLAASPGPKPRTPVVVETPSRQASARQKKLAVIGVSTGGPQALARLLPALPKDFPAPVLIVQHMPALFTQALAESLGRKCAIGVKEAEDGETAKPGVAYIAPGGKHLIARAGNAGEVRLAITEEAPENHCRPSVDVLFRSVALQFPGQSVGVILTGMGNDGAQGIKMLKKSGAATLAQDEASSVVYGMPREAAATGALDEIVPLDAMASRLIHFLGAGMKG